MTIVKANAGEDQSTVSKFIQAEGFGFPVLLDPDIQVLGRMGINSFPTSILVGRDGVVKTIHMGMYTPQALQKDMLPLLREN